MNREIDQARQKQVFDEWVHKHRGLLFKVVRAYAFTPQDRDDLFQEISIQIWSSIPNFRGESKVTTWLYRVALFTAISWARREKKHRDRRQLLGDTEHLLVDSGQAADNRLEWLYDQISRLNEIDRSLTLLMLDGFSYREMADILGISESNVGVKLNRIKKYLTQKSQETA